MSLDTPRRLAIGNHPVLDALAILFASPMPSSLLVRSHSILTRAATSPATVTTSPPQTFGDRPDPRSARWPALVGQHQMAIRDVARTGNAGLDRDRTRNVRNPRRHHQRAHTHLMTCEGQDGCHGAAPATCQRRRCRTVLTVDAGRPHSGSPACTDRSAGATGHARRRVERVYGVLIPTASSLRRCWSA
jgi:hypothetical protein